jgi:predicted esterase
MGERLTVEVRLPAVAGMRYHVYAPKVEPGRTYPLIFALHGNSQAATTMLSLMEECSTRELPVFIVAPQYQKGSKFNDPCWDMYMLFRDVFPVILQEVRERYPIDPSRLYLAGYSMGGMCACQWAYSAPSTGKDAFPYRALFLYSSAVAPHTADVAPDLPYLLFVGEKETAVMGVVDMVALVRKAFNTLFAMRKDARYLEIPGAEHGVSHLAREKTREFIALQIPYPCLKGKGKSPALAALRGDLAECRWGPAREKASALEAEPSLEEEGQAELKTLQRAWSDLARQEVNRLEKQTPGLQPYDRLKEIAALFSDGEAGQKAASVLKKRGKDRLLAPELEARRCFHEAWEREIQEPAAGRAAFETLVAAHPQTDCGKRARGRLQALKATAGE